MKKLSLLTLLLVICVAVTFVSCSFFGLGGDTDNGSDIGDDNTGNNNDNNDGNTDTLSYSNGLEFTSNGDGTCYVSGVGTCTDENIIIPKKSPKNDRVVKIATTSFKKCAARKIVIPNGVTTIETLSFSECENLENISIPSSVNSIEADSFSNCENLLLEISDENEHYVTIDGNLYSKDQTTLICYANGKKAKTFEIPYGVTTIGDGAFSYCWLESVTIPNSVVEIGDRAFSDCYSLTSITIPNSVTEIGGSTFSRCYALASVTFAETSKLEMLRSYTFNSCDSLIHVTLPNSIKTIENHAFSSCYSLTNIVLGENVEYMGDFSFCDALYKITNNSSYNLLPESVKVITDKNGITTYNNSQEIQYLEDDNNLLFEIENGKYTLIAYVGASIDEIVLPQKVCENTYEISKLRGVHHVKLPVNYTVINDSAFEECISLKSIKLPTSTSIIGDRAFFFCPNLTKISIPNYVTEIGSYAFYGCALEKVSIPKDVTYIGDLAFAYCENLSTISVNKENNVYLSNSGVLYDKKPEKTLIQYPIGKADKEFTVPVDVHFIGASAFGGCKNLQKVVINEGVTRIGQSAFDGCTALTDISIPNSITFIEKDAFYGIDSSAFTAKDGWSYLGNKDNPYVVLCGPDKDADGYTNFDNTNCFIPANTRVIMPNAFSGCDKLEAIEVQFGNDFFLSAHGNLYGRYYNGDTFEFRYVLIRFTETESDTFTIPSDIYAIGDYAFSFGNHPEKIEIPRSVQIIGEEAFAFYFPFGNVEICYEGAEQEFNEIEKGFYEGGFRDSYTYAYNHAIKKVFLDDIIGKINLEYTTLEGDGTTCIVTGIGNIKDDYIVIPSINYAGLKVVGINGYAFCGNESIKGVEIPSSVTTIGYSAFENCIYLEKVIVRNGVTKISNSAFCGCTNLTSISLPESITEIGPHAFRECTSLTSVEIHDGRLKTIKSSAFQECPNLQHITIPANVTEIGDFAFYNCQNLTTINFNAANLQALSQDIEVFKDAGKAAKDGITVKIGSNVTWIPDYLFSNNVNIKNVIFEDIDDSKCNRIGTSAFENCTKLTSITIPNSVTRIGWLAFHNCSNLKNVTLSENSQLETISGEAFRGCEALTEINIPKNVVEIGKWAFYDCKKLTTIAFNAIKMNDLSQNDEVFSHAGTGTNGITVNIGSEVTRIPDYLFGSSKNVKIKQVIFASGSKCETIGNCAFTNCNNLTSITIPSGVNEIGWNAFEACTNLESVVFEANSKLSTINLAAFNECTKLKSITIPKMVTDIVANAFSDCTNLESVFFEANSKLSTIGDAVFSGCAKLKNIKLPKGVKVINPYTFEDCTNLESIDFESDSELSTIGDKAFSGCKNLKSITIPSNVYSISASAFDGCSSLQNIYITNLGAWCCILSKDGYNNIVDYDRVSPLQKATNLYLDGTLITNLCIPENVTTIPAYAFCRKSSITSVTIPANVTSLGAYAFADCTNLQSVTINGIITTISDGAFKNCNKLAELNPIEGGSSFNIPYSVATIGNYAFNNCHGIVNLSISNSITSLGEFAFCGCQGLETVKIGAEGVQEIKKFTFHNCKKLTTVYLGPNITNIEQEAFSYCGSLAKILIPQKLKSVQGSAFYLCSDLKEVYFCGDEFAFTNIWFGDNNLNLTLATWYYYSKTKPITEGNYWHYVDGEIVVWG